jgi:hypothetical protein
MAETAVIAPTPVSLAPTSGSMTKIAKEGEETPVPGHPAESFHVAEAGDGADAFSPGDTERNEAEDETKYPTGPKFYILLFSIGLVLIVGAIDATIVATAVPKITDEFHTVADVGWYSSAYRLMQSGFQFMFGKMYKVFRYVLA